MLKLIFSSLLRYRASTGIVAGIGLAAGVLVGAPACGYKTCTAAACSPALSVSFEPDGEVLEDGSYDIVLESEMHRIEIHCVVDGSASSCEEPTYEGDEPADEIRVYADLLSPEADSAPRSLLVSIMRFDGEESLGFDRVDVTVARDGEVQAEETLEPEYERREINGPGCGWCESAEEQHVTI